MRLFRSFLHVLVYFCICVLQLFYAICVRFRYFSTCARFHLHTFRYFMLCAFTLIIFTRIPFHFYICVRFPQHFMLCAFTPAAFTRPHQPRVYVCHHSRLLSTSYTSALYSYHWRTVTRYVLYAGIRRNMGLRLIFDVGHIVFNIRVSYLLFFLFQYHM